MRESRVLGAIPAAAAGRGEGGGVTGLSIRRRRRFLSFERLERAIPCVCPASHANLPISAVKLAPSAADAAATASSANILSPRTFLGAGTWSICTEGANKSPCGVKIVCTYA